LSDDQRRALLKAGDNDQNTPLHLAAKYGNVDVFLCLMTHGRKMIDLNYGFIEPHNRTGRSPLHECAKHNRFSLIKALLQLPRETNSTHLLDAEIVDEDQMTCVHFACRQGKHKSSL
jgi:ankyrin repeat protein